MDQPLPVSTIAHLIQLAIAPVFLLAGIAGILNVLAQRLSRVVDRARSLERDYPSMAETERGRAGAELLVIARRMRLVNLAITACTASALFVCLVVAILFVADFARIEFGRPIAVLFILAMALLILGLTLFLAEIRAAARFLDIRRELLPPPVEGRRWRRRSTDE
jgi:type IV secretory pathway VirB6-like protein